MTHLDAYKKEVVEWFRPYYADADEAHGLPHVVEVMELALKMNEKLSLYQDPKQIIVAAIAHDMYSFYHRNDHEVKASTFILEHRNEGLLNRFSKRSIQMISQAVLEHRASYKGEYSSVLSYLISAADIGKPDLRKIIKRIHTCSLDTRLIFNTDDMQLTPDSTKEDFILRTYTHLKAKYAKDGYARYNLVYIRYFAEELNAMWDEIDRITLENIKEYL